MLTCQRCGSTEVNLILTPKGPHYGKRVCICGSFVKWEPRPRVSWRDLVLPAGRPYGNCVGLHGTDPQVRFAESIRPVLLNRVRLAGPEYLPIAGAMTTISEASWWIANKSNDVDEITWPAAWPVRATLRSKE